MVTPVIIFENTTDSQTYQIKAAKWDVKRKYVRFRYNYINGGTEFNYRSFKVLFEFEWPFLSASAYSNLKSIVESIASGDAVRINSIGANDYNLYVELDKDDFLDSSGEFIEKRNIKLSFISKEAQSI